MTPREELEALRRLAELEAKASGPSFGSMLKDELMTSLPGGLLRGLKDILDTGAQYASRLGGASEAERVNAGNEAGKADFEAAQRRAGAGGSGVTRIGGQLIGTAPIVSALGAGVGAAGLGRLGSAISSFGGTTGATGNALSNLALRSVGGGVAGGLSSGLVDPSLSGSGAAIGAAIPVAGSVVGPLLSGGSRSLMQSAIKPTIKQLKTGDADVAIETLLKYGISPNTKGVDTLRGLIGSKNDQIRQAIAGSGAQINKSTAALPLLDTMRDFSRQVNPTSDLNAITGVGRDFLSHPFYQGAQMPVQAAQELKQGTYKILAKKYGQVGTAETEAQKAIARGLKDEIAAAVPAVKGLNAEETRLLKTLDVAERRALMELNKNPMGLSLLSGSGPAWAAFMADRSAAFKALAARMMNRTSEAGQLAPRVGLAGLLSTEE